MREQIGDDDFSVHTNFPGSKASSGTSAFFSGLATTSDTACPLMTWRIGQKSGAHPAVRAWRRLTQVLLTEPVSGHLGFAEAWLVCEIKFAPPHPTGFAID